MRLETGSDGDALFELGVGALHLLCRGEIATLANRYGYALSFGQDPETAIRNDLARALSELGARSLVDPSRDPHVVVKFFKPNTSNFVALVECFAPTDNGDTVLAELIVTNAGAEIHVTLEQVSGPGAQE